MTIIRIPVAFILDQEGRELPCGAVAYHQNAWKADHATIEADDATLADILDDAERYAHRDVPQYCLDLKSSARATAKALRSAGVLTTKETAR